LDDSSVLGDLQAKEDDGEISVDKPAEENDHSFDSTMPSCSSKQDFPEFKSPSQQSQFSVTSKRGIHYYSFLHFIIFLFTHIYFLGKKRLLVLR